MKIAMSCAGEGFGHVSRMIGFAQGLRSRHELVLFAPQTVQHHIRRSLPDAEVVTIPHFHLVKQDDRINYPRTLRENLVKFVQFRGAVRRIRRELARRHIDAVISDFDPYLPAAARAISLPILQVNHPGVVTRYASLAPDAVIARATARLMMGYADRYMYVSFYNGDVGPILREQFDRVQVTRGDYYVVYLKPSYRRHVTAQLQRLGVTNYRLFPSDEHDFVASLAGCKGVITSAGHQSLSEAVTLGKPVFAIPQRGQFEQRLNAAMLARSGWGRKGRFGNLQRSLGAFIRSIDSYPRQTARNSCAYRRGGVQYRFVNDRERAVQMIEKFIQDYAGTDSLQRAILNMQHGIASMQHGFTAILQNIGLAG
ncbi:glycosyltransferase family protein [Spirochaeta africana]|uniref:Glycosyltransferase family 28 n=1 Tax=Spirochaeta africana (strain ATCC 700263 / DSM 8902 / Z-7692) TaxID=889378 RepID=H9UGV5_SPIAZ|nr:glycosyltransferase family protein [Spirochaeta africana]AFG36748.1 glycosyltransferase family 28 [Spirochaeta africana DSM 8902]